MESTVKYSKEVIGLGTQTMFFCIPTFLTNSISLLLLTASQNCWLRHFKPFLNIIQITMIMAVRMWV